jgi:uncharacterized protein (TIGR00369 family)
LVPRDVLISQDGLSTLRKIVDGTLPQPPISAVLGFWLTEVSEGCAVFEGVPELRRYNPIGSVHAGFATTLLDSARGCAVWSTTAKDEAWTTLELKVNLIRMLSKDTGKVRAEGCIVHRGRSVRPRKHICATARAHFTPTPVRRA